MDIEKLNLIRFRDVSFGGRMGHSRDLRVAMKSMVEDISCMIDSDLEEMIIDKGYLPVVINQHSDNNETVFLIKKEVLSEAIQLKR